MGSRAAFVALALMGVLGPACGEEPFVPDDWDDMAIQTDRSSYRSTVVGERQFGFTVVAVCRNRTADTVYLERCSRDIPFPIYGVGLLSGGPGETSAYNLVWGCGGGVGPYWMAPGESRTDTLRISGPTRFDGRTGEPRGVLWGRFRIGYDVRTTDGERVADELKSSNEFEVRPPLLWSGMAKLHTTSRKSTPSDS